MAKNPPIFEVTCPCCNAVLKVDAGTKAVISHTAAVQPRTFNDMEEAARAMKEQDSRRDSIFRQSLENQRNAADLLDQNGVDAPNQCQAAGNRCARRHAEDWRGRPLARGAQAGVP